MREQDLVARRRRRGKNTTRPGRGRWRAADLIERRFAAGQLNRKWAVAVVPAVDPSWPALGGSALVLAAWAVAGRVPRGAWPRPPAWLLIWAGASIALAALGNQHPLVAFLGLTVSLGGLSQAALLLGITLVSLIGATILVWTTSVSAISPLLRRVTRWGTALGIRLANCSAAIALGLRMAPMLLDDSRTIVHLVGQRQRSGPDRRASWRGRPSRFIRGVSLACANAAERAAETADAVTARGGIGVIAGPDRRPGLPDALAALIVAGVLTVGTLL